MRKQLYLERLHVLFNFKIYSLLGLAFKKTTMQKVVFYTTILMGYSTSMQIINWPTNARPIVTKSLENFKTCN